MEIVFAGAVLIGFGSAAALAADRCPRKVIWALGGILAACAAGAWVVFAIEPRRDVAVAAAGLTVCAAFELGLLVLQRLLERRRDTETRLAEAEERLDSVVRGRPRRARASSSERSRWRVRNRSQGSSTRSGAWRRSVEPWSASANATPARS